MKCRACGFDNLDTQARCVSCGTFLAVDAAEIPAGPPRARSRRSWRNRWYAWRRRRGFRWRPSKTTSKEATPEEPFFDAEACKQAVRLPLAALPGLPQLLLHRNIRGWIFAGTGVAGILWIALLPGTRWWLWGFAILVVGQVNSLCDLLPFAQFALGKRLLYSALLSFFLFFSLYSLYSFWGMQWLDRQGMQLPLHYAGGVLQGGDIVEIVEEEEYLPGMLVQVNSLVFTPQNPGANYYIPLGTVLIDRLLARGPEMVHIEDNNIFLGPARTPPDWTPLNPQWHWHNQELRLQADQYLFLPSWFQAQNIVMPVAQQGNIQGRVARIRWPWWRRTEFR